MLSNAIFLSKTILNEMKCDAKMPNIIKMCDQIKIWFQDVDKYSLLFESTLLDP